MASVLRSRHPPQHSIRGTVLLVEDDLSLGRTAAELLRCFGYGVVWRATLDGARRLLAEVRPDVVLLDLQLRGEYGAHLLEKDIDVPAPPIVIVSAQSEDECRAAAAEVDAVGILHKPYDSAELLRIVAEVISQASANDDGSA